MQNNEAPLTKPQYTSLPATSVLFWVAIFVLIISGVALPEFISLQRSDYRSVSNYISELGEQGADYAVLINYAGFLPVAASSAVALCCLANRYSAKKLVRIGFGLWIIGLSGGYLSAFLFPCDVGCPIDGGTRQTIHNIAGLVTYPVGVVGLLLIATGLSGHANKAFLAMIVGVALLTATCFTLMALPGQVDFRGLWQRLADYAMFLLILVFWVGLPRSRAQ